MNNLTQEHDLVSAEIADWSREKKAFYSWDPSRSLLASVRIYQHYSASRNPLFMLISKITVLRHRFWSVVTGADIPINSKLGGGLLIPHPNGIVIHPDAVIGPNCLIFQQVTIGTRSESPPVIGGTVNIGAGAKILGNVSIGNHANIGANAVVIKNIPAGKTAVGIPARIVGDH
ncbi:MAG: serine acetyltransferase [Methylotenera sp.]|uniref:serine O-acetyltransferase n=1 Tax=Methylotenera sp. TaxID=2051956 RepID=UPI0027272879|nr:serine acetyltransferase [Methylotenera sp.]MDO9394402.1 serine acetyltransferase [Methylotenera sp.]